MELESIQGFDETRAAFMYIPDISGFTSFVHSTNIQESKQLIHDLLEIIIDSNVLGMEVAEIQGLQK